MANFTAYTAFDYRNIIETSDNYGDQTVIPSGNQVTISDDYLTYVLTGADPTSPLTFVPSSQGPDLSGTLTDINAKIAGAAYFTLSGTNYVMGNNTYDAGYTVDGVTLYRLTAEVAQMLTGNDSLSGSAGADRLAGFAGNDTINGGAGNDWLEGWSGNDSLNGGLGNDKLYGGIGNDSLYGGAGNDTLMGGAGADLLAGNAGNDSINGGLTLDRINYSDGNTLSYTAATGAINVNLSGITGNGSTGVGTVTGADGTDKVVNFYFIQATAFDDTIVGSSALTLEVFEGGAGNDTINGGTITDTLNLDNSNRVTYQNAGAAVSVDLAAGTASGTATGNDTLININQVRGSNHADLLYGSDTTALTEAFEGGAGNDIIDGRGGYDMVRYRTATAGVTVNLATGSASGDASVGTDSLSGIEGVMGSSYADNLIGGNPANDAFEFFRGMEGNDTIDGGTGYDRADYNQSLTGVSVSLGGHANGSASGSVVGVDTLINIEAVRGSLFDDTLNGSAATDIFESFEGMAGNDLINGGASTDRADYFTSPSGVNVNLSTGSASDGWGGTDTLSNIENVRGSRDAGDILTGSSLANKLEGQGGNDSLIGNAGNDTLDGGLGADLLRGGLGNDVLIGGGGQDIFRFDTAIGTAAAPSKDQINDFIVADDTLQIDNAIFNNAALTAVTAGTVLDAAFFKVVTSAALTTDSNDYIVYNQSTGALYYDANGSVNGLTDAIQFATVQLSGVPASGLTNADFIVV